MILSKHICIIDIELVADLDADSVLQKLNKLFSKVAIYSPHRSDGEPVKRILKNGEVLSPSRILHSHRYSDPFKRSIEYQILDWLELNPTEYLTIFQSKSLLEHEEMLPYIFEVSGNQRLREIQAYLELIENGLAKLIAFKKSPLVERTSGMKVLYYDIDGCLLDYYDEPFEALSSGDLQYWLKKKRFDVYACVSGKSDLYKHPRHRETRPTKEERLLFIHRELKRIFPDLDDFMRKTILIDDTDNRCRYINEEANWYYIDDLADHYFLKEYDEEKFSVHLGNRIFQTNPHGNGEELIDWLKEIE